VWSIGYLGGSLFAGRLSERKVGVRLIACGLVIGVAIALIAQSSVTVIYLFGALLIGGALAVQVVSYMTLRASITPDALLGRVGSSSRVLSLGLRPVGLVAVGVVIEATGGRMALLLVAVLTVASSLAFVAARSLREAGTDITS
jgi:hypothetical protein